MSQSILKRLLSITDWGIMGAELDDHRHALSLIKSIKRLGDDQLKIFLKNGKEVQVYQKENHLLFKGEINKSELTKKVNSNEDFVNFLKNYF